MTGQDLRKRLWQVANQIIPEAVGVLLIVVSIFLIRLVLEYLLGKNAIFFDLIPVRYVTDLGEITVLLKFIWRVLSGAAFQT